MAAPSNARRGARQVWAMLASLPRRWRATVTRFSGTSHSIGRKLRQGSTGARIGTSRGTKQASKYPRRGPIETDYSSGGRVRRLLDGVVAHSSREACRLRAGQCSTIHRSGEPAAGQRIKRADPEAATRGSKRRRRTERGQSRPAGSEEPPGTAGFRQTRFPCSRRCADTEGRLE